jgi:site-specific DNA-methyltransferase (adenine-specific)
MKSCQPWWRSDQTIGTPRDLFDILDREFHFDLDPCSTDENAKCQNHYTECDNGLLQHWSGSVFVNPPYGDIDPWVDKALTEISHCQLIVFLLPSRTDRPWFHNLWNYPAEIRWLDYRIKFEGTKAKAMFACFVAIIRPDMIQAKASKDSGEK